MNARMALAVLALLAGTGCGVNSFTTTQTGTATVPGNPDPLGQVLTSFPGFSNFGNIDFSQSQDFANHHVTVGEVTSVKATAVSITITDPSTQDFGFLDTLTFSAQTGSQEDVVAQKSGISQLGLAAPNPTLQLDVTGVELKPYVDADSMSIVVDGSGRPPAQDTTLNAAVTLEVQFKL